MQDVDFEFYADDAKFKLPIKDEDDCVRLQGISSTFYDLCTRMSRSVLFNLCLCKTRRFSKITAEYISLRISE